MRPIRAFLDNQSPSDDNVEVERIAYKARMYHLIDGVLYWKAPTTWWWGASPENKAHNCFRIFTAVYVDRTHHDALSFSRRLVMDSTGQRLRMTRWKLSQSAKTASSFRSKHRHMQILFDLLISPGPLHHGKLISWAPCPGNQEDSNFCSSQSTHSPNGWR
jgi:hypothetical protein